VSQFLLSCIRDLTSVDGNLYATSRSNAVLRYDGETGAFLDVFASGGGLEDPAGLVFGPTAGST
jgi:hypothetical protein